MVDQSPKLLFGEGAVDWDERIDFARLRKDRLSKASTSLKQNGIAACLLTRPENIRYVTGSKAVEFLDQLRYTLLTPDGEPVLYEPHGTLSGKHPWIKEENVRQAIQWANEACGPDATWETAKRFAANIKSDLKMAGVANGKIAIDRIDEPGRQALTAVGLTIVDAMPAMLEARAVKTQDEINCLKMAVAIAEIGWYALYEALKPGVREKDLAAVATEAMLKNGAESIWGVLVSSGSPAQSSDKIIQVGDVVTADFVRVTYMGYNTCYYRNICVGQHPTAKVKDTQKRIYERVYKVLEAIKPGASTADAAKLWQSASEKLASSEDSVWCDDTGHGIGLWLYEYPITNRLWSLTHPQIYKTGMTMAIEAMEPVDPLIGRMKFEEMVVVTDTGAQVITRMPAKEIMVAHPILTE